MASRAARRRGVWAPKQVEAEDLAAFCLHHAVQKAITSSDFDEALESFTKHPEPPSVEAPSEPLFPNWALGSAPPSSPPLKKRITLKGLGKKESASAPGSPGSGRGSKSESAEEVSGGVGGKIKNFFGGLAGKIKGSGSREDVNTSSESLKNGGNEAGETVKRHHDQAKLEEEEKKDQNEDGPPPTPSKDDNTLSPTTKETTTPTMTTDPPSAETTPNINESAGSSSFKVLRDNDQPLSAVSDEAIRTDNGWGDYNNEEEKRALEMLKSLSELQRSKAIGNLLAWSLGRCVADRVAGPKLGVGRRKSLKDVVLRRVSSQTIKSGTLFERDELLLEIQDTTTSAIENDLDRILKRVAYNLFPASPTTTQPSILTNIDSTCYIGLKRTNEDRTVVLPTLLPILGTPSSTTAPHPNHWSYFGVYDGHGGESTADYVAAHLHVNIITHPDLHEHPTKALQQGFNKTNESFRRIVNRENHTCNSGSTGTVCLWDRQKQFLHVAWAGDSPAFLISEAGQGRLLIKPHSSSSESERRRVEADGGMFLQDNDVWRLQGSVTVTRSFGDFRISVMTADPEVLSVDLNDVDGSLKAQGWDLHAKVKTERFSEDAGDEEEGLEGADPNHEAVHHGDAEKEEPFVAKYLVLSSDGLTDVFEMDEVGEFIEQWTEDQVYRRRQARKEAAAKKAEEKNKLAADGGGEAVKDEEPEAEVEVDDSADEDVLPVGIAYALAFDAVDARNSMDNVSVIVVKLR
ncbi:Protein phosphatase 1F [Chytridiales sp. JEL 0842]|nr:Protein phosphatase 1F [Chytridiales sp. JEL 0842]